MRRYTPLVLLAVIPLILSSCWKTDDALQTQSGATNSGSEKAPYTTEQYEAMFAAEEAKPFYVNSGTVSTQDVSSYLRGGARNIRDLIATLTGSDTTTITKRAYLKSYMGDYSGALAERDALCQTDTAQCPQPSITLEIDTTVDQEGNRIKNPNIYLNGQPITMESPVAQPPVYGDMIHRVRVEKEGYLDSYAKLDDAGENSYKTLSVDPTMAKSDGAILMDNKIGGTYTVGSGTGSITYTFTPDTFTTIDDKDVTGNVNLYLFALTNEDNDLSAFQLDVLSSSGENIGGAMITNGMPFVIGYQDGKVLKIAKAVDGIGQLYSDEFPMDFVNVPKNTWLKYNELKKYNLPGYWKLDRNSGVWTESEMQITDTAGHYRFLFL